MRRLFQKLIAYFPGSFAVGAVSLCIFLAGCSGFPVGKKEDPSIPVKIDPVLFNTELFGEEASKTLNVGYFIYKGRYIPPPYIVKRNGLSLFINDIMVVAPIKWRNPRSKNLEIPPVPPDISMWSGSSSITEFIDETFRYYEPLYKGPNPPQDKTMLKAIADHLKKSPNVWGTEADEELQLIRITLCNFTNFNVSSSSVFGQGSVDVDITEDSLRDMYHRAFDAHVQYFKANKIVYKGLKIGEIEWRENPKDFYEAVRILNSDSWAFTKRNKLNAMKFGSEKIVADLVPCFRYSKELEKRLYDEYIKVLDEINKTDTVTPYDKFQ